MREMNPQQVNHYLQNNTSPPLLLDVREPWEYNICHIKGAKLIPMKTIASKINQLNSEQEIIVICHHGVRSRMVGQFLEQQQFKQIINLSGGVNQWAKDVDINMPTY
jgi:rhodanese-related sulfurtransferase